MIYLSNFLNKPQCPSLFSTRNSTSTEGEYLKNIIFFKVIDFKVKRSQLAFPAQPRRIKVPRHSCFKPMLPSQLRKSLNTFNVFCRKAFKTNCQVARAYLSLCQGCHGKKMSLEVKLFEPSVFSVSQAQFFILMFNLSDKAIAKKKTKSARRGAYK